MSMHYSLYVTQINEIKGYSLVTRGDTNMVRVQNPTPSDGAYKIPPLRMRVVTKSISMVFYSEFSFANIATIYGIFPSYKRNFVSFNCNFF